MESCCFFSQDLCAAVLTSSFPRADAKSIHIFYYTHQSFCFILFHTAAIKALFCSRDFISERRKKTNNEREATEHLCDHVSEQETLAILSVGKTSFRVHYLTLEMTASPSCQLPANCWWGYLTLLLSHSILKPQLYTSGFFLSVMHSRGKYSVRTCFRR